MLNDNFSFLLTPCWILVIYFLRILIVDVVDFFVMFDHSSYSKYFLEKSYILLWFILLLKKFEIYNIILNI
jgi:hypothetical protein